MPRPDLSTNGTVPWRKVRACARVTLSAAFVIAFALAAPAKGAAEAAPVPPREKDVRRAEKVLAKLRLLSEAGAARDDPRALRTLAGKLYPGLFVTVADMRESDLKTDLDTAVFLYEAALRAQPSAGFAVAGCEDERPDIYLPLCLDLRGGTLRQLLLAKARLHTRWGEAVVAHYRGGGGDETTRALSEMKAARQQDFVIAARVVSMLKNLETDVHISPTYADYQERRALTRVGFDQLDGKFGDALSDIGALLAVLPRSDTFYLLSAAWRSYRDGVFWCRKVYQSRKLVVSASGFAHDPLEGLKLDADLVGHAVVTHWGKAREYTRRAEQSLAARG